jgi:hypothetical protein
VDANHRGIVGQKELSAIKWPFFSINKYFPFEESIPGVFKGAVHRVRRIGPAIGFGFNQFPQTQKIVFFFAFCRIKANRKTKNQGKN